MYSRFLFGNPRSNIAGFTRCKVDFTVDRIVAQKMNSQRTESGLRWKGGRADGEGADALVNAFFRV